ncbi:MAG TPA: aldose 1-epimerase family protein, partial [Salinarimonas sp.]|nr:aldose 1-epimerase family protein [Salinarimonas sp.]
ALVLRDARSRWMRLEAPSGAAIAVEAEDFPHLALWTRPGAPFLSLETWTGHADPEGFSGDIADKPGMRLLAPGASAAHRARLAWSPAR